MTSFLCGFVTNRMQQLTFNQTAEHKTYSASHNMSLRYVKISVNTKTTYDYNKVGCLYSRSPKE